MAHARGLLHELERTEERLRREEPGFDPRLLLKVEVVGVAPEDFEAIHGLQVVSQEGRSFVLLFADEVGLADFRRRLSLISRGHRATRESMLLAIRGVSGWTREDRTGAALRHEGWGDAARPIVDVELWPLDRGPNRDEMLRHFGAWCEENGIQQLDRVNQDVVILFRVQGSPEALDRLLEERDVRLVDLPPRYQFDVRLVHIPLADLPPIPAPAEDAPGVVVLDSGLASNHPLLAEAVGDAQSFLDGLGPEDEHGHGTMVAGVALYGDVAKNAEARSFVPELRLFSGRITDRENENATGFVENHVVDAVMYFVESYGCKVFNLSFGDSRKAYLGGHVRGLAAVLDSLSRHHGVLFTVSAGNFLGTEQGPADWRREYPDYLFDDEARLIDPAPALNVLTVGSLARYEVSRMAGGYPRDPAHQPIARADQPSPFSRAGPGPLGSIKPDVAEYGGNWYIDARDRPDRQRGGTELGELSTSHAFVGGNLFSCDSGTSMAAPRVAHLAARLLQWYPEASANLLRALIVAHARVPTEVLELLANDESKVLRLVGYGKPDWDAAVFSAEHRVTLVSDAEISGDQTHYYEVPLPPDFFLPPARRRRNITVALAHSPYVRTTRYEYKQSSLAFRVVRRPSLDEVVRVFRHTRPEDRERNIPEIGDFRPSASQRAKGTVQSATWTLGQVDRRWDDQKLFVVVTQNMARWAPQDPAPEPYSLVVSLEDEAEGRVRYYAQIQQILRARVRV